MRAQKQRNCVKDGFHHTIENNFFEVLDFFNSSKSGPSPTVLPLRFYHRQPKRTMFGFGLQRSFGRNILELLVYYLMPNKCKNLKDTKSSCLSICTSSLQGNEGRDFLHYSNFIICQTCIRIYNAKKKNHDHAKY